MGPLGYESGPRSVPPMHTVTLEDGKFWLDSYHISIQLSPTAVRVGCHLITREAFERLAAEYKAFLDEPREKFL